MTLTKETLDELSELKGTIEELTSKDGWVQA